MAKNETTSSQADIYLDSIARHAPFGIIVLDNHKVIRFLNAKVLNYLEQEGDANLYLANYLFDFLLPFPKLSIMLENALANTIDFDLERVKISGRIFSIRGRSMEGGTQLIFENNTDLFSALEKERVLTQKLASAYEEMEEITHLAAHELKSPLITIDGLLDLFVKKGYVNSDNEKLFTMIQRGTDSLLQRIQAVNYFLKLRKAESDEAEIFDPSDLFQDVLSNLSKLNSEIHFTYRIKNEYDIMYFFPKNTLERILDLLLQNSFVFRKEEEQLNLNIDLYQSRITIKDNSKGFDVSSKKDRLFRPFQRFDKERSGPGMGLYLAKMECRKLNIQIDLDSSEGSGTFVTLTW